MNSLTIFCWTFQNCQRSVLVLVLVNCRAKFLVDHWLSLWDEEDNNYLQNHQVNPWKKPVVNHLILEKLRQIRKKSKKWLISISFFFLLWFPKKYFKSKFWRGTRNLTVLSTSDNHMDQFTNGKNVFYSLKKHGGGGQEKLICKPITKSFFKFWWKFLFEPRNF